MAILQTSAERAKNNVTKAAATVSEWEAKAAAARSEAAEIDATAGAAILADESAADRISLQVLSLHRKARAYDQAAAEAGKQLQAARIAVLTAEADESDKAEVAAVKRLEKHRAAIKDLLDKLEALEGTKFIEAPEVPLGHGESREVTYSTSEQLEHEAFAHRANAAGIRYFLLTGVAGDDTAEINRALGTSFATGRLGTPESVLAAIAAGTPGQGA